MIHNLFSVPIAHYEVENWESQKQIIMESLPQFGQEHLDNNEMYTDFFHMEEETLPPYADVIIPIVEPYLAQFTERRRVEFTDMWCQTSLKGQYHGIHNHGHSGWSCILYVEFNPKLHDATQFISPFNNPWSGRLQSFIPPINEGDLIIFPTTVHHQALENKSDVPRTIVSFNLRGKVDKVKRTLWEGDPIVREQA